MAKANKKDQRKVKARDAEGKPVCGAKKRSGGTCRNKPMHSGRCRLHGGASTGAPKGNQNARKHGLYSEYYTPEEEEQLDSVELGRVDDELKLCRIKLRRWLRYENEIEKERETDPEAGMALEEHKHKSIDMDEPPEEPSQLDPVLAAMFKQQKPKKMPAEVTRTKKRINIEDNIDRLLRRIESLERTRKLLIGEDGDTDFEDELEKLLNGDSEA